MSSIAVSHTPLSGDSVTAWLDKLCVRTYDLQGTPGWYKNPLSPEYLAFGKLCTEAFGKWGERPENSCTYHYLVVLETANGEPIAFLALHNELHCCGGSVPTGAYSFYCKMVGGGQTCVAVPSSSSLILRTETIDYSGALLSLMIRAVPTKFCLVANTYPGDMCEHFYSRGSLQFHRTVLASLDFQFTDHVCGDKTLNCGMSLIDAIRGASTKA